MSDYQLSDEDLRILDIIANLEPLSQYQISGFWLARDHTFLTGQVDEILNKLSQLKLISVESAEHQKTISLNDATKEKVLNILTIYWKRKNIQKETLLAKAENNYIEVLKLIELKSNWDNKSSVTFSDYYRDIQSYDFCQTLMDAGMVFKHTSSSRKHYYETYYLRKMPLDIEEALHDFVLNKVNLEGLKLETDWKILAILIFSQAIPKLGDIVLNFPDLTDDEIYEIVSKLESRGILIRERDELKLSKAMKDIIKSFFMLNQYSAYKTMLTQQLRQRISERTSNLFLLGLVRHILNIAQFQKTSEPFSIINKNLIKDMDDAKLRELSKLGIVLLTENEVIIAHEVLVELETIFKSAVSERSVIRIPAYDIYTATVIWRRILGQCKNYIKIQDEYVNEETLQIIQSYSPSRIDITILTSIEGARDADVDEIKQRINAIRNAGKKIDLFFIGYRSGKAPFHYRYLISKDLCYSISTSLKDVGKSKDADFIHIPQEEKEGLVEPAFNYWISVPRDKLKEIEVDRMNFDDWLKTKMVHSI